ncbi:MAG: tetratricopeptide repeat protein [Betaproteobacteria bacterium]|nr:tetratricopeptide repeat protein [Betaproteobacteria bacterium]
MNPPWKLVALAFVLVGSVNTIDVASGDPGSPGLVGRSNATGDSMLLLAALTTSDRDQARQLVAEAAALMDAFGGPGMALGEAAAKLRAALQINPDEPAAHLELARLAMKSGGGLEPPTSRLRRLRSAAPWRSTPAMAMHLCCWVMC